ncbi:MAG: hypothetical protein KBS77_07720 [Bacteroidales bacterium]|nr:hypothetical protein [Candidatus Colicola faecequi]
MEAKEIYELIERTKQSIKDLTLEEAVVFFEELFREQKFTGVPALILAHTCKSIGAKKAVVTAKKDSCSLEFIAPRNGALKLDKPEEHEK